MRALALVFFAAAFAGCLHRTPVQKLNSPEKLVIATVLDPDHDGAAQPGPAALNDQISERLRERNFEFQSLSPGGSRLTSQRLAKLREANAPWTVLVETRASFFSQLDGRYRWTVAVRLSAAKGKGEPIEDSFTAPALLMFDHQRGPDAVAQVSREIADRLASLLDGLMAPEAPAAAVTGDLLYFAMVDRFANGEPENDGPIALKDPAAFHGGDLQGLTARLDWLDALGVKTIWVSPVFSMRTAKYGPYGAFHGYWTYRLDALEPRFGGDVALRELTEKAHQRGMKVVLDLVLNHVGPDAPLVKEKPTWFHHNGGITNWNDANQLLYFDVHGLPDLATENPEVYGYLKNSSVELAKSAHLDGFRLDAVKHLPLDFWAHFNGDVSRLQGADFMLLGEVLDGAPDVLARTQRDGQFTHVFDFPLHYALMDVFCRDASPARLASVFTQDRRYANPANLVTLLDNHDLPRVMTACGRNQGHVLDALTALIASRGTPSMIWGTEVGLEGKEDPLNRASMQFDESKFTEQVREITRKRSATSLRKGSVVILAADAKHVAWARVSPKEFSVFTVNHGDAAWNPPLPASLNGSVPATAPGQVSLWTSGPLDLSSVASAFDAQWRTGSVTREVQFKGPPSMKVVGSGPEFGDWKPAQGMAANASVRLPVRGVFEFKLFEASKWEGGENRVLFVDDGDGPLAVNLEWRGS